jgi:glutamate racemase
MNPLLTGPCLGVFDSGVGGLSVLRALRRELPSARLLYLADSGHAPYGERDEAFVIERSRCAAAFLRAQGAQLMVVACNTATAAAVRALRDAHPGWPLVGIEPGIKPAVALTHNSQVGVMATQGTLVSAKFRELALTHGGGATLHLQACTGLAQAIEGGDAALMQALVAQHTAPLRAAGCDVVALGCTHYPFALPLIAAALGPQVQLVDTADAVARHTARLAAGLPTQARAGDTLLWSSGDPAALEAFARRWLDVPLSVRPWPQA